MENTKCIEQSNFYKTKKIVDKLRHVHSETLFNLTAKKLGKLANIKENEYNIKTWINSGICFNPAGGITVDITDENCVFEYNKTYSFVETLEKSGLKIYDNRYAGFYENTHKKLMKKYENALDEYSEKTATLTDKEIVSAIISSFNIMRESDVAFEEKNNKKWHEERDGFENHIAKINKKYDSAIETLETL